MLQMIDWSSHTRDEIVRAANVTGQPVDILDEPTATAVREALRVRYCRDEQAEFHRNNLKDYSAVHDPDSFLWVTEFLGGSPGYLLYDSSHPKDRYIFRVLNGPMLRSILEECFGFQFYVTDDRFSFAFCSTDDDCLMGCGRARPWIESRRGHTG